MGNPDQSFSPGAHLNGFQIWPSTSKIEIIEMVRSAWWLVWTPLKNDGVRQLRDDESNPIFLGKCQIHGNHSPPTSHPHPHPTSTQLSSCRTSAPGWKLMELDGSSLARSSAPAKHSEELSFDGSPGIHSAKIWGNSETRNFGQCHFVHFDLVFCCFDLVKTGKQWWSF